MKFTRITRSTTSTFISAAPVSPPMPALAISSSTGPSNC